MKEIDRRTKWLLWFLFQPEDSPGIPQTADKHHRFGMDLAGEEKFPGVLKTTVWIILSVLVSLILAHFK